MNIRLSLALLLCSILLLLWGAPSDKHIAFFALLWGFLLLYQLADLASAHTAQSLPPARHSRLAAAILKNLGHEQIRKRYDPALKLLGAPLLLWALGGCAYLAWVYAQQHDLSQVISTALPGAILLCFLLHPFAAETRHFVLYWCGALFVFCCVLNVTFPLSIMANVDPGAAALSLYPFYFIARRFFKSPLLKSSWGAESALSLILLAGGFLAALCLPPGPHSLSVWCAAAAVAGQLWAHAGQTHQRRYRIFMR
jgi:hypothetical protein